MLVKLFSTNLVRQLVLNFTITSFCNESIISGVKVLKLMVEYIINVFIKIKRGRYAKNTH